MQQLYGCAAPFILLSVSETVGPRALRVFFGASPLGIAQADYASRLETWEKWDDVAKLAQGSSER